MASLPTQFELQSLVVWNIKYLWSDQVMKNALTRDLLQLTLLKDNFEAKLLIQCDFASLLEDDLITSISPL